ncbi:MAG: hypothetical protein Q7K45_01580 [Nanoarchaeota archaeon]|nr:hypothetical protein [Nanoarchaeota archaeon]
MDKSDTVYREHSMKEHLILAVMIVLTFFFLTSQYNSAAFLPSLNTGTITGAATTVISKGSFVVWGVIMLLLILGIIAGLIIWWKNHRSIQVQRAMQQDVDSIIKAAGKSSRPITATDLLTKKLNKVQQELVTIPLRSATKGHVINTIPTGYKKISSSSRSVRHLLSPKKVHQKAAPRRVPRKVKHRPSLNEKMMTIKNEIGRIKTK